jgi:hypothetical protein
MNRYIFQLVATWIAVSLICASFNFVVDPYMMFETKRITGFNAKKPYFKLQERTVKIHQVESARPDTLLLGNSRIQRGFDPELLKKYYPNQVTYNSAVPGGTILESRLYFEKAILGGNLKRVVIGMELEEFLPNAQILTNPNNLARYQALRERVQIQPAKSYRPSLKIWDQYTTLFSIETAVHSAMTVIRQRDPGASNITVSGFNDLPEAVNEISVSGHFEIFQRNFSRLIKNLKSKKGIVVCDTECLGNSEATTVLRDILELAATNNIEVILLINPYHAGYLELLHELQLWQSFEDWRYLLIDTAERYQQTATLWDFSGYGPLQSETVPPKGDTTTRMIYHIGPGHFSNQLGALVLERLFGSQESNFGKKLTSKSPPYTYTTQFGPREQYVRRETSVNCRESLTAALNALNTK